MATSSNTDLCDICANRNRTNHAIKWCPECEEKLCEECFGQHSVSKVLRNHGVIDMEQYQHLPESILGVKNYCSQHDMKLTNFCQQHEAICCPACISGSGSHSSCKSVVLQEVIQTAKTSVLLQSMEGTLRNLKQNLKTLINNRQTNLQNLHDQRDKILKDVKQMKEKIVKHLNDFEKNISDDLNKTVQKNSRILNSEITSLQERLQQAEAMLNESNTIKQYGSDLQIFIGSKSMETEVTKINNNIQELVNNDTMKQVGVKLRWDSKVNDIIKQMPFLGSILEEETPMAVVLLSEQGPQVQVMPSTRNISIEDITITQKSKFQVTGKNVYVRGGSVFPNNKAIIANSGNKNIVVFKENGEKEKVIPTSSSPYDVTIIDDNTVAVSTGTGVEVINITTNTVEKTINIGVCYGLEYYKGSLFCCVPDKCVLSVDLSTSNITTVVQDTAGGGWYYCTVYNDRIYTTRSAYNTVTCYTLGGDKVWEFNDRSVIYCPIGIAVDNSSNIYIASYINHSIVVLSPDGQRHRTLLTHKDGIRAPYALHFGRSTSQLLVGNVNGPGHGLLFKI